MIPPPIMSVSFFIVPDGFFQIVASAFDYLLTYSKLSTQIKQKLSPRGSRPIMEMVRLVCLNSVDSDEVLENRMKTLEPLAKVFFIRLRVCNK